MLRCAGGQPDCRGYLYVLKTTPPAVIGRRHRYIGKANRVCFDYRTAKRRQSEGGRRFAYFIIPIMKVFGRFLTRKREEKPLPASVAAGPYPSSSVRIGLVSIPSLVKRYESVHLSSPLRESQGVFSGGGRPEREAIGRIDHPPDRGAVERDRNQRAAVVRDHERQFSAV